MTIDEGPGRTMRAIPIRTTVPPITPTMSFRSLGDRSRPVLTMNLRAHSIPWSYRIKWRLQTRPNHWLRLTEKRPGSTLRGGGITGNSLNEETMMKKSKSSANARKRNGSKPDGKRLIDLTPRKRS